MSDATDLNSASGERWTVLLPNTGIRVKNGDRVMKGDKLTDGQYSPHDVLRVLGLDAAHLYLTQEVQKVYRQQGVDINDKHIEVIARQMLRRVRVTASLSEIERILIPFRGCGSFSRVRPR